MAVVCSWTKLKYWLGLDWMSEFKATKRSSACVEATRAATEIRTEWDNCIVSVCVGG